MAINTNLLRRPSDRNLFLVAAIGFPLLVFVGYFKTYYFSLFFDVKPIANALVHAHGVVMSLWVIYFAVQVALIRSKNVRLHMTMGFVGIALAVLVVVVGMATAYDAQLVRASAPPGVNPHSFFILPVGDMVLFVFFFAAAIYYRRRPAEHKSLMLLTAINFLPAAFFRVMPVPPSLATVASFGTADVIAVLCLIWFTIKHSRLNRAFAVGVLVFIASMPLRAIFAETQIWLRLVALLAPTS